MYAGQGKWSARVAAKREDPATGPRRMKDSIGWVSLILHHCVGTSSSPFSEKELCWGER